MESIEKAIMKLGNCAKPILFETELEETPYSGAGTCFLVKNDVSVFLITARHAIEDCNPHLLSVFPNIESDYSIPFCEAFRVANRDDNDLDFSDIVLLQVDVKVLKLAEGSRMTVLDLNRAADDWRMNPYDHRFVIFGFPNESREVDYENQRIISLQKIILAGFQGESPASYCVELNVEDANGLTDFNGLSGSPVFSYPRILTDRFHPSFCGMVLRGTKQSGRIHFLDARVIRHAIEIASSQQAATAVSADAPPLVP